MKGLIIEGVSSSGKTGVLQFMHNMLLRKKPANTKLFISEHYSVRMLEHIREAGSLTEDIAFGHCLNILDSLEMFEKMKRGSKFSSREGNVTAIATIERFLLTHIADTIEQRPETWGPAWTSRIKDLYSRLSNLGFIQAIFTLSKEELQTRLHDALSHRNAVWNDHVAGFGGPEEIIDRYWKWQGILDEYSAITQTVIPQIVIDMAEANYEGVATRLCTELLSD